jgi:hypothetical protein
MTRDDQPRGSMLSLTLPIWSPKYEKLQDEVNRLRDFSEAIWMKRSEVQCGIRSFLNPQISKCCNCSSEIRFSECPFWHGRGGAGIPLWRLANWSFGCGQARNGHPSCRIFLVHAPVDSGCVPARELMTLIGMNVKIVTIVLIAEGHSAISW